MVLHAGANDISDAEPAESVVDDLKKAASVIGKLNPDAKILISSIIPRRNDSLVNSVISETNRSIKHACQQHSFIDNDENFCKDTNKIQKLSSFKSNENIHKREDGSYHVVSANKASSVTL